MFGILYTLFGIGVAGSNKIKQSIDDEKSRERAKKNGDLTYYGKGGLHLTSNGKLISRGAMHYTHGDEVIRDMYTGEIYVNLSKEKRNNMINKAKQNGKTVINISSHDNSNPYYERLKDKWWFNTIGGFYHVNYKDVSCNKYYRTVCINGYMFYMDIDTGLIEREIDNDEVIKGAYTKGNLLPDEIIAKFNQRQLLFPNRNNIIGKNSKDNYIYYLVSITHANYGMDNDGRIYLKTNGREYEITKGDR